jgi:DNA-directed RNA polymerase subunit F
MIVKEILDESSLTLAEAKELLDALRTRSAAAEAPEGGEVAEMRYERRKASEHTTKFAKLGAKESRALISALLLLPKMKEEIAIRMVDIMPRSPNEVRAIYAKERFTLTEADIGTILDLIAQYE